MTQNGVAPFFCNGYDKGKNRTEDDRLERKGKMEQDVAALYREIGNLLRAMGAERVYLYSAKNYPKREQKMQLEIVTDGAVDTVTAKKQVETQYPEIELLIWNGNEPEHMELFGEVMTDSIQI